MRYITNKPVKTAVVMAAGMGTRFGHNTDYIPKGFIECGGISMIERSIKTLIESGIEHIIIGTGYHREKYESLVKRYSQIECVFSPRYADTNSMYTLFNCREAIGDDDFLLLESDLIYEKRAITSLIDNPEQTIMLITPATKFQDQYYVAYDETLQLTMCSTDKTQLDAKGELVGIHKLSNTFFKAMCLDYSTKVGEHTRLGYEYELLSMAQNGSRVYVQNIEGLHWYEIDDSSDLSYAEKEVIPYLNQSGIHIKRNVLLNPGPATTTDTVKMAQVVPDNASSH